MASDYEKKLVEMQFQLKENQQYMSDTFKELESWSDEMKVKEEKIRSEASKSKSADKDLPPIRALATVKKKKKVEKKKSEKKTVDDAAKIKAYDYRKWDKFDVDAACERIDEEKSSSSCDSADYTTDEEWEEEQKKNRANWEKERGNLYLKENSIDEAINCYTRAIELDSTNAIFPANRAMCLLKQDKFAAAEVDCTLAITLDPKYVKAYHRRGTARAALKRFNEAKEDFEQVLKLEPFNKAAQEELAKIEHELESLSLVFPINKPVEQRSKKPLKRIQIQEINVDVDKKLEAARNEIKSKIVLNENEEKLFSLSETKAKEPVVVEKIEKVTEVVQKKITTSSTKSIPTAPTNGFQFRKDWQLLSNNLNDLTTYFKQITPDAYSKLFMNGLESDMLSKMLFIFKNFITAEPSFDIYPHLWSLSQVNRFQTQFLFLSNDEKKVIQDLLENVRKNTTRTSVEINELEKTYKF